MLHIRTAVLGDIEPLRALDPIAAHDGQRRDLIAKWVAQGKCEVALAEGILAGYAVWNAHFFHQHFIEMLTVGAQHRRNGVGLALVRHCAALTPAAKIWTSTNWSNAPMQALLARAGFVPSGRIDNLDEGDRELVFVRLPMS